MTRFFPTLKTAGRAALLVLALGTSSLVAMPAQAQSEPRFNFQLGIGPNGPSGFSFGFGNDNRRPGGPGWHNPGPGRWCMNDQQVRRAVQDYGFRDVRVGRELGRSRVEVIARWGRNGGWYSMRVDRCTGEVDRVERIRRNPRPGQPGFGFQFNF